MTRRIATYERVSTDSQREKETILTQYEELKRRIEAEPEIIVVERFIDDGVSGATELKDRPGGAALLRAANLRLFDEVWVYKLDRLGRDDIDPLVVRRDLAKVGVKVVSLKENLDSALSYGITVIMGAEERRNFRMRSVDGINRAAASGRYCGGIVPLGYRVDGIKQHARFVVDDQEPLCEGWTAKDVVVRIFERLVNDGASCYGIADELNMLGIPTHYVRDGRLVKSKGRRAEATAGAWRPGRIRAIVRNTMYRGLFVYRKRAKDAATPQLYGEVPRIVSDEMWHAAQAALKSHLNQRKRPETNFYLLRGLVRSAHCGHGYAGTPPRPRYGFWYRCVGKIMYRQTDDKRCGCKGIRGDVIEPLVWADVERFLLNPGLILDELAQELRGDDPTERLNAELAEIVTAERGAREESRRLAELYMKGQITEDEHSEMKGGLIQRMEKLQTQADALREALATVDLPAEVDPDLCAVIRERLQNGLSDEQRREVVQLLVRDVIVHTEPVAANKTKARVVVTYNFPAPHCVYPDRTGTDSTTLPA